jgi:hypothetical protein
MFHERDGVHTRRKTGKKETTGRSRPTKEADLKMNRGCDWDAFGAGSVPLAASVNTVMKLQTP